MGTVTPSAAALRPSQPLDDRLPARSRPALLADDRCLLAAVVLLLTGFVGLFMTIGADARWLAALGKLIVARGSVPRGVPFASASTAHWVNTLVLAELIFHGLESVAGDRGLAVANLVAVTAAFGILAADARAEGARPGPIAIALLLVTLGAYPTLAVVRVQMFSLALLPAMVALLHADERRPSRRIWLALPLLALWSNLHGGALAGLAILYAYLALSRAPRARSGSRGERLTVAGVALGAPLAMSLTPGGLDTIFYYHGLLTNVAAQRGFGQWAPLGTSVTDWLLVASAIVLALGLRRQLPRLWETVVIVAMAALTVKAARDGVWLLFLLVAPAARGSRSASRWEPLAPALAILGVLVLTLDIVHGPDPSGVSQRIVERAIERAHGAPILADALASEEVALAGGKVWAGNPLDAFSQRVQSEYVDFLQGEPGGRAALRAPGVRFVLAGRGSAAAALTARDDRYRLVAADATAVLYQRVGPGARPPAAR